MYDVSFKVVNLLRDKGMIREGDNILDMGCGNGRYAIALSELPVNYVGVDVIAESVDFCKEAFAEYGITFHHMDIRNGFYHPSGAIDPEQVMFPGKEYDLVIAHSLFTHLETLGACKRYVEEALRVLKPGGRFFSTWFRSPPNALSSSGQRTVLAEADILNLLQGFTINHTWGGLTAEFHDQWMICATKRS